MFDELLQRAKPDLDSGELKPQHPGRRSCSLPTPPAAASHESLFGLVVGSCARLGLAFCF